MKTDRNLSNYQKGQYVVPVAIIILVIASIGLILFSWWGTTNKKSPTSTKSTQATSTNQKVRIQPATTVSKANDDATLDKDGANIQTGLNGLDKAITDVNGSFNDTPILLQ